MHLKRNGLNRELCDRGALRKALHGRPEAVRRDVDENGEGWWLAWLQKAKAPPDEGLRPEELSSENDG